MFTTKISEKLKSTTISKDLMGKITQGTLWLSFGGGTEQGLRLVRNILLTRILTAEVMGELAIILAFNAAFESFTQIGVKEAVIQNEKGFDKQFLDSAWWLSFGRAVVLCFCGFSLAPLITSFYDTKNLTVLLQLSFLNILFNGSMSIKVYTALKKMDYKRYTICYYGGGFLGISITIALSYVLQNVNALVIGYIAEAFFRTVLSYILFPYIPTLAVTKESFQPILEFAKGMFGLPILYFVFVKSDIFILGKFCSKEDVGLYSMTSSLAQIPAMFGTIILEPILLPLMSKYKNDKIKMNKIVLQINQFIMLVGIPLVCLSYVYGDKIMQYTYGEKYSSMGNVFAILMIATLVRLMNAPIVAIYYALGKPSFQRFFSLIRAIILLVFIIPLVIYFKSMGAGYAILIALFFSFIVQLYNLKKITNICISKFYIDSSKTILFSLPILIFGLYPIFKSDVNVCTLFGLTVTFMASLLSFFKNISTKQ
jgi:lipopolysaccharide exporter